MIYLVLAILCSAMLSIVMRLSERHIGENVSMLAFNYITCTILSLVFSGVGNIFPNEEGLGLTLGMGLINGFLYLGGFVLLQVNVKRNGVVMSTTLCLQLFPLYSLISKKKRRPCNLRRD